MILGVVVGLRAEARLIPARLGWRMAVAGGHGRAGAERAAASLIADGVDGLLSFGLAGGLSPIYQPGDLLIPDTVIDEHNERHETEGRYRVRLGPGSRAPLLARDAVIATAAAKRAAFESSGCVAVDLESGAVARAARQAYLPFAVFRAVCDPAERDLPAAALAALDAHGTVGIGRVARSLLTQGGQVTDLLALARDAARARRALAARLATIGWPLPEPA